MLRFLTAGESHGRALVVIVEGLPGRPPVTVEQIAEELARRRLGYGRGPRMRFEADEITLIGGIRHGRTLGLAGGHRDRQHRVAASGPRRCRRPRARPASVLTQPRPGHADLAGMQKYGFDDARDVLERASARETAARVAAGALAKALLAHLGVSVLSHVVQLGPERAPDGVRPEPGRPRDGRRLGGALLRPGSRGGDGGRGQGGGQGRRLPGRGGRGPRLRRAGRAGQPRPLGPQARRPAGPGPHEHPGRQGGRDRRGLGRGRPAGVGRPTTPSTATRGSAGYRRDTAAGRRHRGRHVHRRAWSRPGWP